MKLPEFGRKVGIIIICIFIAYSSISYIMLLFIGSFAKSVIEPMTYANINFMNCEMQKSHASCFTAINHIPCEFMNAFTNNSDSKCSIDELKNLANNMPMDKSMHNTGFLTDVVFLGYQNSILKDTMDVLSGVMDQSNKQLDSLSLNTINKNGSGPKENVQSTSDLTLSGLQNDLKALNVYTVS